MKQWNKWDGIFTDARPYSDMTHDVQSVVHDAASAAVHSVSSGVSVAVMVVWFLYLLWNTWLDWVVWQWHSSLGAWRNDYHACAYGEMCLSAICMLFHVMASASFISWKINEPSLRMQSGINIFFIQRISAFHLYASVVDQLNKTFCGNMNISASVCLSSSTSDCSLVREPTYSVYCIKTPRHTASLG